MVNKVECKTKVTLPTVMVVSSAYLNSCRLYVANNLAESLIYRKFMIIITDIVEFTRIQRIYENLPQRDQAPDALFTYFWSRCILSDVTAFKRLTTLFEFALACDYFP